jgi:gamma-glutamylcysteine synthetase
LKSREKELSDSLKESTKANSEKEKMVGEREKHISQITANHKKIENELYRTISVLEEEKERVNALFDKTSIDKRQLEETLRIN